MQERCQFRFSKQFSSRFSFGIYDEHPVMNRIQQIDDPFVFPEAGFAKPSPPKKRSDIGV